MLIGGGGGLALLGGGWFVFLRDSGVDGPGEAVEAFYSAIDNENIERAEELTHDEGSINVQGQIDNLFFDLSEIQLSVDDTEVLDEDLDLDPGEFDDVQEFDLVEAEVTTAAGEASDTETTEFVVALDESGDWLVWEER